MKKALIILCGVFGLTLSVPSQAEWTRLTESASGDIYYYDYETVKWAGGTAYAWVLTDYIKPSNGVLSFRSFVEVECGTPLRFKWLSTDYMSGPMGKGDLLGRAKEDASWSYPRPNTVWDSVVGSLCQVGKLKG